MRALIFHDGALGDVLLSLACIVAVGKQGLPPDIVCRSDVGRLLMSSGLVREAFSSDSVAFSSWYTGRPTDAAREFVGRYGRIYVFTQRKSSALAMAIARAVPDTRIIVTVPPAGDRTHVAEFRLRQLPIAQRDDEPVRLNVRSDVQRQAAEVLARTGLDGRRLIVLHPGSGGKRKCWPLDRYFALAEQLAERAGAFILFLAGPAEELSVKGRLEAFVLARPGMGHSADEDLSIVAGLLAQCSLFVGNDAGISHLAAAAGAPAIALFGPTDPALWRPCGDSVQVIAAGTMDGISVDTVLAAAENAVARACSA